MDNCIAQLNVLFPFKWAQIKIYLFEGIVLNIIQKILVLYEICRYINIIDNVRVVYIPIIVQ